MYSHWAKDCNQMLGDLCENCGRSIHRKEDCLKSKDNINNLDIVLEIKGEKLKCAFC